MYYIDGRMVSLKNLSLVCLKPNECARIKEISAGCKARKRLCELGLHKGANVRMVKNDFGPIILNLSGHKLALGRGIANNVIIENKIS